MLLSHLPLLPEVAPQLKEQPPLPIITGQVQEVRHKTHLLPRIPLPWPTLLAEISKPQMPLAPHRLGGAQEMVAQNPTERAPDLDAPPQDPVREEGVKI